jgi:succinate dehydrogenase/fumarate reductase flavoprotein subunit
MWEKAGPLRDAEGLREALEGIEAIRGRAQDLRVAEMGRWNPELVDAIELPHMLASAEAIAASALARCESRGAHVRSDFPDRNDRDPVENMVVEMTDSRCRVRRMEAGK